jgi:hypothetical protein
MYGLFHWAGARSKLTPGVARAVITANRRELCHFLLNQVSINGERTAACFEYHGWPARLVAAHVQMHLMIAYFLYFT